MILVTVGAQMPFDRLIQAVDAWAASNPSEQFLAQVGPGAWLPRYIPFVQFLAPDEFRQRVAEARAVVSHAGMGTVLTALELGKPLLLMPRRGDLRETRNDHQVATARQLVRLGRVTVAFDERELHHALDHLDQLPRPARIGAEASPMLIQTIRNFIVNGHVDAAATGRGNDWPVSGTGTGEPENWPQLIGRKMES